MIRQASKRSSRNSRKSLRPGTACSRLSHRPSRLQYHLAALPSLFEPQGLVKAQLSTRMASCHSSNSAVSSKGGLAKSDSSLSISSIVSGLAPAAGSKRRLSAEVIDPPATAKPSKQPCLSNLTAQEQDKRPPVSLSRSDSAMSADTQLLCTEAFGTEDDSSSAPVSNPGEGVRTADASAQQPPLLGCQSEPVSANHELTNELQSLCQNHQLALSAVLLVHRCGRS